MALSLCASVSRAQENDRDGALRLLELVNGERRRAGIEPLEWDDRAAEAALRHARWMAQQGELSHRFPGEPKLRDRLSATGLRFNDDAENVAFNSDIESAHQHLMQSAGHRANILNPRFDAAGFAVIWKGARVYVAENFVRRIPEISDNETAARVLAAFNRARKAAGMKAVERKADLHDAACHMARKDRVSTDGLRDMKARSLLAFTTFLPEELPPSLESRAAEAYTSASIGACFARSPSYPSGTNWVVMVLYP
jgi:uncharacterized protein YkwD